MTVAYSPTTWNTNDVITKDKLNKIEQGVKTGTLLSGTDIDADKDWAGKAITNIGALQNQTGNIGALSGFVDVPGGTTRKSFSPWVTLGQDESATVATVLVPDTYSSEFDSNLRVAITKSTDLTYDHSLQITIRRNGTVIGSGTIAHDAGSGTVDTTGGFRAGDTLVIEAKNAWGGTYSVHDIVVQTVVLQTARKTDVPAYRVFPEPGAW